MILISSPMFFFCFFLLKVFTKHLKFDAEALFNWKVNCYVNKSPYCFSPDAMKSPTSPSFLETAAPTSLFGINKGQIVRNATQGWPTRLTIGSVITSDNKLGRFDKSMPTYMTSLTGSANKLPVTQSGE